MPHTSFSAKSEREPVRDAPGRARDQDLLVPHQSSRATTNGLSMEFKSCNHRRRRSPVLLFRDHRGRRARPPCLQVLLHRASVAGGSSPPLVQALATQWCLAARARSSKSNIDVLVQPGHNTFALIPYRAPAVAISIVNPTRPCFAAVYPMEPPAWRDAPDPMLMIRPNPRSRIAGSAVALVHHAEMRLKVRVLSNAVSSPLNGSGSPPARPPTLLTSTSIRPKRSSAARTGRLAS